MRTTSWWPLRAALLVLLAANFAPQCHANLAAMSIDLGSQFIKIGLVKPGVPMEIVLSKESERKTPNILSLRNGERAFGDVAAQTAIKFPVHAITFSLDLIGKQFDNPIVAKYQRDFPHLKLSAHPERNTVVFDIDNKSYEVETILAMILWNAREQTQAFADQPVKDVVIAVPPYWNQAERTAVATAAKIAGFHLLSLISDGSAAALNYGVFRRKDITEKSQTLLVYDVGATTTTATLVEFVLVEDKNNKKEKMPSVRVLGLGYDRTTGGKDLTDRLRDHLVAEFRKKHKTSADITTNPRAMAKLWKEAERVKQVLSANTDHFAQIESVFEDKDFKVKVSRELIEEFVKDQWPLLAQPLKDALASADFKAENVDTIVLMGAGTRVPAVQQILKDFFKGKELARFLNTDEAIALGAVYEAAHLSKGFRVKPFDLQDTLLYPIQVSFTGLVNETNEADGTVEAVERPITRELYSRLSRMPGPRKTITFTSHKEDFDFRLHYGPLDHLSEKQRREFGSTTELLRVNVKDVAKTLEQQTANLTDREHYHFNGIKAVFRFTRYGAIKVESAELTLEHRPPPSNSTLSKIVDKLGSMFSGSADEQPPADGDTNEQTGESAESGTTPPPSPSADATAEPKPENTTAGEGSGDDAKKADGEKSKNATESATPSKPKDPPKKHVRARLPLDSAAQYPSLSTQQIADSGRVLAEFERTERAKRDREAALHSLESLVFDLASRLEEDAAFRTTDFPDQLKAIEDEVAALRTWLEDEAYGADTATLRSKHSKLQGLIRAKEQKERKLREQKQAELRKQWYKNTSKVGTKKRQWRRLIRSMSLRAKTNKTTPVKKADGKSADQKKHAEL
ncbi:hypothetical protein M3Y99_00988700 [Aphelenchoides fujianensis]|nr:hypothetical protein M3Y99_00988700 [Aphelenchoides fujianensis]